MPIESILVVDDEPLMLAFLTETLKRARYRVECADNGKKALFMLKEGDFDLVITDMTMPKVTGLDVLKKARELGKMVVIMTGNGTIENAVEAMRLGAFSYLLKPFTPDQIEATLEKAEEHLSLVAENRYLREEAAPKRERAALIAKSPVMTDILSAALKAAESNASILIHGESGTGKEVMAAAIHAHSLRASKPYIRVNCAAIPDALIESEFFGHEKGSFTGADQKRIGRFELADKGTLLLDEITEIPIALQPKLLRVIQEMEFERVGGSKPVEVDVRIISTSNRDLKEAIQLKQFREDLYYRLNVVPLHLPPLRKRKEDILPIAEEFLDKFCKENRKQRLHLTQEAKGKLLDYDWPGNIRELGNIIERTVVLSKGLKLGACDVAL